MKEAIMKNDMQSDLKFNECSLKGGDPVTDLD